VAETGATLTDPIAAEAGHGPGGIWCSVLAAAASSAPSDLSTGMQYCHGVNDAERCL
jgi:hypothetical protein